MSLHTRDTYEKLSIVPKVNSSVSYNVIYTEFTDYEDCLTYLRTFYAGLGDIISLADLSKISTYSELFSHLAKIYCEDPRLIYAIYGLLEIDYSNLGQDNSISIQELNEMTETVEFNVISLMNSFVKYTDALTRSQISIEERISELTDEVALLKQR